MKALIKSCILLFSIFLSIACSKEKTLDEVVYAIPMEDRCAYEIGDTLFYSCSDGTMDTAFVKELDFNTETGTYSYWGVDVHTYVTETQTLVIELSNDNWNFGVIDSRCFRINSKPKYDDINVDNFPWCEILNGCEYAGARVLAENLASIDEKTINTKTYKKLYYHSVGDGTNGFEFYWNLKYGIVSFKGISDGTELTWELEGME